MLRIAFRIAASRHEQSELSRSAFTSIVRIRHDLLELVVDLFLGPAYVLEVLDPLEVRDGDTTRVAEDIREDRVAISDEDRISATRGEDRSPLRQ